MQKYLYLGLLVAVLMAVTGWQAYKIGGKVEANQWRQKEVNQAKKTIEVLQKLNNEAREQEALANDFLNNVSESLREIENERKKKDSIINRQYADIERLRWNLSAERTASSEKSAIAIPAIECDGKKTSELSKDVSRFIFDQFGRCDEIVGQLTACQDIITFDRQFINQ